MGSQTERPPAKLRVIRWSARIWSVAAIVLVLGFIVGEGLYLSWPWEWLGFLFFPVGIVAGMIVAFRKEGLGGSITVASLLAFYLVHVLTTGKIPKGWGWLIFSAPGFLYMLCWYRSRTADTDAGPACPDGGIPATEKGKDETKSIS